MSSSQDEKTFSAEMRTLVDEFKNQSFVTIEEIGEHLRERGAAALLFFLSLPMVSPIALPGLSVILGLPMSILAIGIVRQKRPTLPKWLIDKKIEYVHLVKIVDLSNKVLKFLEKFAKPRFKVFYIGVPRILAGISMISGAIALALPFPPIVPFTNLAPGVSMLLFSIGFLEEDGIFILLGHVTGILAWIYLATVSEVVVKTVEHLFHQIFS